MNSNEPTPQPEPPSLTLGRLDGLFLEPLNADDVEVERAFAMFARLGVPLDVVPGDFAGARVNMTSTTPTTLGLLLNRVCFQLCASYFARDGRICVTPVPFACDNFPAGPVGQMPGLDELQGEPPEVTEQILEGFVLPEIHFHDLPAITALRWLTANGYPYRIRPEIQEHLAETRITLSLSAAPGSVVMECLADLTQCSYYFRRGQIWWSGRNTTLAWLS